MLDQNTDRMWYVIGAVVIGAGIIFLANGMFADTVFPAIKGFMEGLIGTATENVDKITTPVVEGGAISLFKSLPLF